ncbi:hypothetical protein [Pseudoduganella albidiflava]|uniref:Uncharacterized protein n=1 Tax=Pseudoduganella albidiflava TaxID=321983 RepID=A0AA88C4R2_9BURK|nr:hypothetical protein [Pseudoduganella albidiflava]GGY56907.1 hypothetical protein GCM10007387_44330 [Pseudoduganella albidiflava]
MIEKADARGFVLSGYEIALENEQPVYVEQVWLLRPLTAADSLWLTADPSSF